MISANWPRMMLLAASWCAMHANVWAEDETFSTGNETWSVDKVGTLITKDWPLQSALKWTVSRTLKEKEESGKDSAAKPAPADPSAASKTPVADSKNALPDLRYGSDSVKTLLAMDEVDKKMSNLITRSLRFDPARNAVRVLDVISNSTNTEQELSFGYTTRWRPEIVPKVAKPRKYYLNKSPSASGVLVTTSGDAKLPILMFLFGAEAKGWTRTLATNTDTLTWTYHGKLAPRQRITLLHWVTFVPDVQTATLDKAGASFIAKGMPLDDSLDSQVLRELINYPVASGSGLEESSSPAESAPPDLYFLKSLTKDLCIERSAEYDQLVLKGGPTLKGEFDATELNLSSHKDQRNLSLEDIAAIQGGAGTGRATRVYFRDGTVASGVLSWKDATFKDALVGRVKLTPDTLNVLILRITADKRSPSAFKAFWVSEDGNVRGLAELPADEARLRWWGGVLRLNWTEVRALRQLPPPELGHEVSFKDGSRIRGWLAPGAAASCQAYATTWADLTTALEGGTASPEKVTDLRLRTSDGSLIAGSWDQDDLKLATGAAELKVPAAEIRSLTVLREKDGAPVVLAIDTRAGASFKGQPVSGSFAWKWNGQKWLLPWSQVSCILGADSDSAPSKP